MSEEKKSNCGLIITLVACSLLLSICSLILSVLNYTGAAVGTAPKDGKVVISKMYDKGQSLDKAIATKKPMVVFFYTDWCGFCQRFAPTFNKITKDSKVRKNVAVAYVNCEDEKNSAYVQDYGVQGYPTVYVVKKDGTRVHLDNGTFFKDDALTVVKENILKEAE